MDRFSELNRLIQEAKDKGDCEEVERLKKELIRQEIFIRNMFGK